MSSRLKLQKDTAARKKAEQQVLQGCQSVTPLFIYQRLPNLQALLEKQRSEHELFDSLKGTNPGTAGRLYGGMLTRLPALVADSVAALSSDGQSVIWHMQLLCLPMIRWKMTFLQQYQ